MADLIRWKPFNSLVKDFFDDFSPWTGRSRSLLRDDTDFIPHLDIKDTDREFEVSVDIPGLDKKDLDVSMEDGVLLIKGERNGVKREEKDGYTYYERHFGHFERRVRLPENLDESKVKATYTDGVLRIKAAKTEVKKPESKKIEIK